MIWGVAIVYLSLNKGLPYRPSSALYPLMGNQIFTNKGKVIDVLCVVAQLFGTITCLGLAALQVAACFGYVFPGLQTDSLATQALLIAIAGIFFVTSSATGMKRGIRYLSNFNSYIYIFLIAFLLLAGPTVRLLEGIIGSFASGLTIAFPSMLNGDLLGTNGGYGNGYAAYYYVWALVFGPVGGTFYAKACLGRSYRQFILGILGGTFVFLIVWFICWGGNAIYLQSVEGVDIYGTIAAAGLESSNWALLSQMPLSKITIPVAAFCALIGFVTLADSITNTVASITTKHGRELEAPMKVKLYWGIVMCVVTIVLLTAVAKTGLSALQAVTVAFGLIIMLMTIFVMLGYFKLAKGEVDEVLDNSEQGKRTYELVEEAEKEF